VVLVLVGVRLGGSALAGFVPGAGCLLPGGSWPGGGWLLPCLGGQWLARGGAFGWVWFSFLAFFCGFSRSKKMRLIAIKAIKDIRRDNLL
jgi:hypothetical protein